MKKISLKDIKNGLSRNEMKTINGGGGSCCLAFGTGPNASWDCGFDVSMAKDYYADGGRGYCCASCKTMMQ